ncbi:hypothetical protein [Streptomyces sp. NBC_01314]|uniref:hypothetical protein n=1 Tax=Streptomyces sp. NBC_01314 TaxID=2903821 RepID=UPI00308C0D9E|nr:hypothetical protein OG622_04760 [Streptomyces sp. NBC_01314]
MGGTVGESLYGTGQIRRFAFGGDVHVYEHALTDAFTPTEHAALCAPLERATTVLIQQTRHRDRPAQWQRPQPRGRDSLRHFVNWRTGSPV